MGVEAGRLKVAWGWRGAGLFVALMPGPAVSDGAWHDLALSFGPNVTLWTDASPDPVQRPAAVARPVATGAVFFVGKCKASRACLVSRALQLRLNPTTFVPQEASQETDPW